MRNTNKSILRECENTLILIEQFRKLESFLDDFNFLIFGRDNIVCRNHVFSLQRILNSAQATLGNVVECCKCFCLADAYTLLRKYRDDLFFCLYLVNYDVNIKAGTTHSTSKMENNIDQWCKNSLAYALASDEEKELIAQFFIKTEEKLRNYTTEQLRGYSYSMLGVDLSVKIEEWITEKELTEKVVSEDDLLFLIVEFFLQNEECKLKDKLYEICCLWIKGKTPIEISLETGCDISDVDDVCNKVISYRLNILIGNICDLINVPEDDDTKVNPYTTLNALQNKIKYGVSSQTAISICEKIFNDRVLASKLSGVLMSETIDTDSILRIAKRFEDSVLDLLNDYPGYFSERLNYLLR